MFIHKKNKDTSMKCYRNNTDELKGGVINVEEILLAYFKSILTKPNPLNSINLKTGRELKA